MPGAIINVPVELNDLALDVKLTAPATGALTYRAADGFWTDLDPPGVAGQVLKSDGAAPFWGAPPAADLSAYSTTAQIAATYPTTALVNAALANKYDKTGGPLTGAVTVGI